MTPFNELRDAALAAVDGVFAEPIFVMFFKDQQPDPSRTPVQISAVLRVGEGKTTNLGAGLSATWRTRIVAGAAELHIDPKLYIGPVIKPLDKVRALNRTGQPIFEVKAIDTRSHTRLVLQLNGA